MKLNGMAFVLATGLLVACADDNKTSNKNSETLTQSFIRKVQGDYVNTRGDRFSVLPTGEVIQTYVFKSRPANEEVVCEETTEAAIQSLERTKSETYPEARFVLKMVRTKPATYVIRGSKAIMPRSGESLELANLCRKVALTEKVDEESLGKTNSKTRMIRGTMDREEVEKLTQSPRQLGESPAETRQTGSSVQRLNNKKKEKSVDITIPIKSFHADLVRFAFGFGELSSVMLADSYIKVGNKHISAYNLFQKLTERPLIAMEKNDLGTLDASQERTLLGVDKAQRLLKIGSGQNEASCHTGYEARIDNVSLISGTDARQPAKLLITVSQAQKQSGQKATDGSISGSACAQLEKFLGVLHDDGSGVFELSLVSMDLFELKTDRGQSMLFRTGSGIKTLQ